MMIIFRYRSVVQINNSEAFDQILQCHDRFKLVYHVYVASKDELLCMILQIESNEIQKIQPFPSNREELDWISC